MNRDDTSSDKIALLATGDEICNGDILNSNSQDIAQRLFHHGMHTGMHMVTSDHIAEIEKAIHFLLQSHRALIITGGLGPTSDDLTRYALTKALNRPLEFNESVWQTLSQRLQKLGYSTPPESNRQQALFPESATIIPNPHGTAAGCQIRYHDQWIFMLPGPPMECMPMIDQHVLPTLKEAGLEYILYRKNWLLFGVSEGQIAEELDAITQPFKCTTGYRLCYPYIEFKIYSNSQQNFNEAVPLIEKTISPYLLSDGKQTASALLKNKLETIHFTMGICDHATGGLLENSIKTPENHMNLFFSHDQNFPDNMPYVVIKGLNEFWQGKIDSNETQIEITFINKEFKSTLQIPIPLRGSRVKQYATEWASHHINQFCSQLKNNTTLIA